MGESVAVRRAAEAGLRRLVLKDSDFCGPEANTFASDEDREISRILDRRVGPTRERHIDPYLPAGAEVDVLLSFCSGFGVSGRNFVMSRWDLRENGHSVLIGLERQ